MQIGHVLEVILIGDLGIIRRIKLLPGAQVFSIKDLPWASRVNRIEDEAGATIAQTDKQPARMRASGRSLSSCWTVLADRHAGRCCQRLHATVF